MIKFFEKYKFTTLIIISIFFIVAFIIFKNNSKHIEYEIVEDVNVEPETKFGINVEDYHIIEDIVLQGQTISDILSKFGMTALQIDKIAKMSSDTFNITNIITGRPYSVFIDNKCDTNKLLKYFVYENSPTTYTFYDFSCDNFNIELHNYEIDTIRKTASGVIESSLWNTIVDNGYIWDLALTMTQIYAWTVDFYALQKFDAFKVIYDELFVNGKSVGVGEIKAGVFYHKGKEVWAIPFVQDSIKCYYDTLGNNTRKTFLKAPLKYTRVSSRYSTSRMHPIHKRPRAHLAVDFAAPTGTPIYSASDGRIVGRAYGKASGYYVKIKHNSVYSTVYMHLSRFGKYNVGDFVSQGDVIGYVGSTGWSTGPHLHYEIHKNAQKINPLTFEPPPAEPVDSNNIDRFNIEKRKWIEKINSIEINKKCS